MQKFHQSGQSQQFGQQQLFVDLEGTGQGIRGLQLFLSGPDAACGGGLLRHSEEIAALVPFDVGENVLGRRQGREMCPCAVQPQGSKAGGGLCGGKGGILPQHRLPQPGQQALGGPLLEQHPALVQHQRHRDRCDAPGLGGRFLGQGEGSACGPGPAERAQRALLTQGGTVGQADQRAQLHQGLIVVPGLCGRLVLHDPGRELPLHLRVGDQPGVVVEPGKHPQNVSVHGGHRETEADGCNGPRRVLPDAGQGQQGVVISRQLPAVLSADDLRCLLQIAHPAVITQPLPQLVQLFLLTSGQRGDIRQGGKEALVVGQRRRDPGLLQHDLAQPDMVGRRVLPEGEDAAVGVEPVQQGRSDIFHLYLSPC